jgi:hypothetical protein
MKRGLLTFQNKDNKKFKADKNLSKRKYGRCTKRLIHFTSLSSTNSSARVALIKKDRLNNYKLTASAKVLYKILDFRSRFGFLPDITGNDLSLKDSRMLKRIGVVYTERKATGYSFKIDLTKGSEYLVHLFIMVKMYLNLLDNTSDTVVLPAEVYSNSIKLVFGICEINEHLLNQDFFRNKNNLKKRELGLESVRFISHAELVHIKLQIFIVNELKLGPEIVTLIKSYLGISNLFELYKCALLFN